MKILMLSSELEPFAHVGSMGARVARLAGALQSAGHEVTVVLPLYRMAREAGPVRKTRLKFSVQVGNARFGCQIYEAEAADGSKILFIGRDEFFDRSGLYGNDSGDYQDNSARFIFFVKAALQLVQEVKPDVIHAHGWQSALAPVFVKQSGIGIPVVLTPHGLDFQGNFWSYDFGLTNLPGDYFSAWGLEFYGSMNFLKAGLLFSDGIVLADEREVAAAQTRSAGCGLETVLSEQARKIWGIPDGSSVEGWDPSNDKTIAACYDAKSPASRQANRIALRSRFGWQEGDPVLLVMGQLSPIGAQFFEALDRILSGNVRLVLLGAVEPTADLALAKRRHGAALATIEDFSENDARALLAGSDFLLIPEETTHAQPWLLRALRYGVVPVARQCPGLGQFVNDMPGGNGFLFWSPGPDALVDICRKAFASADREGAPTDLVQACLNADFSMALSAQTHTKLYARVASAM